MAAVASGEDERPAHPAAVDVADEAETAEGGLGLDARRRIVDAGGRPGVPACAAALDRKAGQGAGRDLDAPAAEQDADLHHGELLLQPRLDLLLLSEQPPPALAVAVGPAGTHPLADLPDELVAELLVAPVAIDAHLDRSCDVAPCRLAVDAGPAGDRPFTVAVEPPPHGLAYLHPRS